MERGSLRRKTGVHRRKVMLDIPLQRRNTRRTNLGEKGGSEPGEAGDSMEMKGKPGSGK